MKYEFKLIETLGYLREVDDVLDEVLIEGSYDPDERTAQVTIKKDWKKIVAEQIKVWLLEEELREAKIYLYSLIDAIEAIEKGQLSLAIDGWDYNNVEVIINES